MRNPIFKIVLATVAVITLSTAASAAAVSANQISKAAPAERPYTHILKSQKEHGGDYVWKMKKASEVGVPAEKLSLPGYNDADWMEAIVPGTVLHSLVENGVYPDPYYADNNDIEKGLIPDLARSGRDEYTYWFRTKLEFPYDVDHGRRIWMQFDGVNYHAEVWLNGRLLTTWTGMFWEERVEISEFIRLKEENVLAIKVTPIDSPGTLAGRTWGAGKEFHNGGDGWIGRNVTMLMSAGWDFTFYDGVRDRNTGIWKDIKIYQTREASVFNPFVRSQLSHPNYDEARETISVEVVNNTMGELNFDVEAEIEGTGIVVTKPVKLLRCEKREVVLTPEEFPQLIIKNPKLWWPINKGPQNLYNLKVRAVIRGTRVDEASLRFGIREVRADRNTPDKSKTFYVNGRQIFIQGTNWIPEAMCRANDKRIYAQLRYTAQTGINLLRLWGGGITESEYFYSLCDELGILVWEEFWMTGDTKHPVDQGVYLKNVASAVRRTRTHPCLAFYVCSNESTYTQGVPELINMLDGTLPYQMQSECDGVHDGSPYKTVNPMSYYENTASERGSRVDGFNPEYGAPCLPTAECIKEMMDEKDWWPVGGPVWNYMEGNGFYKMTTLYKDMADQFGESSNIDEYAERAQFVGAMMYRGISDVWRYNQLTSGDRFCSGYLFWFHNSPIPQTPSRMWHWSLEPTAALYAMANASEPVHPIFDYIKNTVSVASDLVEALPGCKLTAEVIDVPGRRVLKKEAKVDVPAEGTACDVIKLDFPENIYPVHFIKLRLADASGTEIGSCFYWRSTDEYKGANTVSGPCTAGFQTINNLPVIKLRAKVSQSVDDAGEHVTTVVLKNTAKTVAFFTRLQWLGPDGGSIRPSFYSDNFFSMMPGESRTISINNLPEDVPAGKYTLVVGGFRQKEQRFTVEVK
ncbi:MAG: glycoside hydrolase family 2 [Bacteroidales bacterium]|nr:glycoside hydrolase family 2 [Bacteroidales bacterium]